MGQMINLDAADGFVLSAYRADPAATPRGGLVVAQEIFGVNSHIRSVCDGFAADGYAVIAPALFDRYERGVDIGYTPADIDFARSTAHTTFGWVGVKVWIYKGEVLPEEFKKQLQKSGEGAR